MNSIVVDDFPAKKERKETNNIFDYFFPIKALVIK
jgi:hypothetical protein